MILTPVSFDNFSLNDTSYESIIPEDAPARWKPEISENDRSNDFPQFAAVKYTSIVVPVTIKILGSGSLNDLKGIFNAQTYKTPTLKKLIVEDENERKWSVMGYPMNLIETSQNLAKALIHVPRPVWSAEDETESDLDDYNEIEATNEGNVYALPTIEITAGDSNPNEYAFNEFVIVANKTTINANNFPLCIKSGWDTATLVTGGYLQADLDDIRVTLDGTEIDFWLDTQTGVTAVWTNLNLPPRIEFRIAEAVSDSWDDGEVYLVNESKSATALKKLPPAGAFLWDNELCFYDDLNAKTRRLAGIQRAQRGTAASAHNAKAMAVFIPFDLRILYGKATAEAPNVDDSKKPAFDLAQSSNAVWVYDDEFGDLQQSRSACWIPSVTATVGDTVEPYTSPQEAEEDADPIAVLGHKITAYLNKNNVYKGDSGTMYWTLINPLVFNKISATASKYRVGKNFPAFKLQSSSNGKKFTNAATEASPVSESTWTNFSITEKTISTSSYKPQAVRFQLTGKVADGSTSQANVEVDKVTLTNLAANIPLIVNVTPVSNYQLSGKLTNQTTGDAIEINYPITAGQTLIIDTQRKVITYLDTQVHSALVNYPKRAEWLPIIEGDNTLVWEGAGVEITMKHHDRMVW